MLTDVWGEMSNIETSFDEVRAEANDINTKYASSIQKREH